MKLQHTLLIALLGNLVLLGLIAARPDSEPVDVLTVKEFRVVDGNNKLRASIKVETEAVVFRLCDSNGTIRVKIGADANGSGFVFLDDQTNPGIHGLVKKSGSTLTVTGPDGKKREY